MAKKEDQKLKLLYLKRIFEEETNEEHALTLAQLGEKLSSFGISWNRKTMTDDMEKLRRFGLDIETKREGRSIQYYLASRTFEVAELKLLVDSIQSSKFITEKKTQSLIKKLETLTNQYDAKQLQRQVMIHGRIKNMNESIYYNVDKIYSAISANKKIQFTYLAWDKNKKLVPRHDNRPYVVSPWYLLFDDEKYYLLALSPDREDITHYRVDKMKDIVMLNEERYGQDTLKKINYPDYINSLFGMYSGEKMRVELEGENDMINVILDRFGADIPIIDLKDGYFKTAVMVSFSNQFLGWIAGLGGKVWISGPEEAKNSMKEFIATLNAQYTN